MQRFFWFLLTIFVSVAYLLLFKQFVNTKKGWLLIPILLFGIISFYGYYQLFLVGEIGVIYGILTGSIIVLMAISGVIFFHERPSVVSWLGLFLITIGVILLSCPW